jgi:hypothetical protein
MRLVSAVVFGLALATSAFAIAIPEIDPASGVNAIALLGGAALVVRSWRRK